MKTLIGERRLDFTTRKRGRIFKSLTAFYETLVRPPTLRLSSNVRAMSCHKCMAAVTKFNEEKGMELLNSSFGIFSQCRNLGIFPSLRFYVKSFFFVK